ncbi:ribosome recycling factor [Candidatus Thiothrix sp. Deng01]|uniref:Ribosome-recycling factor n=1 Tax=Candidatus Thiothrix phosphatis TaxID=3112415 RepID=A0ABU6CYK0_9GAMM|nr:ribosome recycling factor [Candidatus Thiothrix sp. Deng01]MEB4591869.1 ribosome recycling factor [Candidatus Thiothrix sp. Deng01]
MIEEIKQDADQRMQKSIEALKHDLAKVRTGRAHPSLLDQVTVDYYGTETPIGQVANVGVEDARTLKVTPWEKPMLNKIEKAILTSNLGLNPTNDGNILRVPLPALTEERRRDFVKVVKGEAESARVAIRNIRRDANSDFKSLLKDKEISEDEARRAEEDIQKLTDRYIKEVEGVLEKKEKELMEV